MRFNKTLIVAMLVAIFITTMGGNAFAATKLFLPGIKNVMNGTIDLDTTTIKAMPVSTEYTFNEQDDQISDITATSGAECTSTGFSRLSVGTITLTQDNTNHWVKVTSSNLTYSTVNGDVLAAVVLYADIGGADSTRVPIVYLDGSDITANGGDITYVCPSNGWFYIDNL